ncbi:MAG: hypothetical protein K2X27_20840, partial [Candidatus Obscuribacterales bacterium]|nr:hypothetical protein [Candidatus Obscuribacterales bacterium]
MYKVTTRSNLVPFLVILAIGIGASIYVPNFFHDAKGEIPAFALFPGELMIFGSALKAHTGAALAALFGAGVGVAALLSAFRKVFHGPEG